SFELFSLFFITSITLLILFFTLFCLSSALGIFFVVAKFLTIFAQRGLKPPLSENGQEFCRRRKPFIPSAEDTPLQFIIPHTFQWFS
ncbi:hypothetical protein ACMUMV_15570, partial [Enterococcus faecalis]|uniref:hypothetical protein n=1 Tax=Enterococcus faecalis TaxID=1351 RepID=UPI002242B1E0